MKKSLLLVAYCLLTTLVFSQNRPHYSLYMLRQNIINPAAIGTQDAISAAVIGNTQINGFAGNPKTIGVDLIVPIGESGFVTGLNAGQDRIGVTSRTNLSATLGYRLKLAMDHYLTFGVNAMGVQLAADYSTLIVDDATDPFYTNANYSTFGYDISAGLHYFTNNLYNGVSTMNLTDFVQGDQNELTPTTRMNPSGMHLVAHAGYQHKMGENWKIMPSVLYKGIAGSPDQFDVNLQFKYNDIFGFGPMYRTSNSFAFQANTTLFEAFTVGYSYNMGTGFKTQTNFMGHELLLMYKVKNNKKRLPVEVPHF